MGKTGPKRKTHCGRGHKFTPRNTIVDKRGYRSCKACAAYRSVTYYRERKRKNSEKRRSNPILHKKDKQRMKISARERRLKTYGITEKDYKALIAIQNSQCAICNSPFDMEDLLRTCHIDHDHNTGVVRGLLCGACNLGLGKFKDNLELLSKAKDYLQGKRALIFGIGGQDGHYLAHLLVGKGYEVHGLIRRTSQPNSMLDLLPEVQLHEGDITDFSSTSRLINEVRPHEIYNLAAQSHVGTSFKEPLHTTQVNYCGVLNILESVRLANKLESRIYQASTSEMFGGQRGEVLCNEDASFYPRSPYGVAKVAAHHAVINYREAYGLFACNGILFNHESPRRGPNFVTRKITLGVAAIKAGKQKKLYLGNLSSKRDWGYAKDYVRGMYLMLNYHEPQDFVLATGETHSVREFCELAFDVAGLGDYRDYVEIDPRFFRAAEVDVLVGDASKAKKLLGWEPELRFEDLVKDMVSADLEMVDKSP